MNYKVGVTLSESFVIVHVVVSFPDLPSFETLCRTADEELFKNIISTSIDSCRYLCTRLRPRRYNFELPDRVSLTDCNFI